MIEYWLILHIFLHFLLPAIIAWLFYPEHKLRAWLIMMATMAVDLDHLLADPIYDPNRCSIGFHPLHRALPIGIYLLLMYFPKTRLAGAGLSLHMLLDSIDCQVTNGLWYQA